MAGDREPGSEDAERSAQRERARIARELTSAVAGLPAAGMPDALCRACMRLLPEVSGLSASLAGRAPDAGIVLFASDEVASRLAEIQFTLGEGPCTEALRLRAPVLAVDLARGPDARRWPLFAVQAAKAGVEAVFSVPLPGAASPLGTLDLYRETAGGMSNGQLRTALLVADALTLAVDALDHALADPAEVVTWLQGAESDREEIHQATGMIMVQLGVSAQEALLRLRARAFAQDQTSADVARAIINRTTDLRHE
ncbi:GAF and ANTAR domain-containing protein [Streptomyces sp. enrichment culture]|uniref:GAF and ANTAR domain-containing protein n=1 Tax=Streptomyces sp. enrichment culture TaxID=1795815 RepID=UPI003F55691C